jgi:hypothetical protein
MTDPVKPVLSKRQAVKDWLRRHKGWVTFACIAVIITTYVVKDVLRDRQKDLKDAVENARRTFLVGRGIDGLYSTVFSMSKSTDTLSNQLAGITKRPTTEQPDYVISFKAEQDLLMERLIQQGDNDLTYLQQALFLCDVVPKSEEYRKEINENISFLQSHISKLEEVRKSFRAEDVPTVKSLQEEVQQVAEVTDGIKRAKTLRTTLDQLLERAEKKQEEASKNYEIFEWVSILLFVLGIGIGLCAQVAGIEPPGA